MLYAVRRALPGSCAPNSNDKYGGPAEAVHRILGGQHLQPQHLSIPQFGIVIGKRQRLDAGRAESSQCSTAQTSRSEQNNLIRRCPGQPVELRSLAQTSGLNAFRQQVLDLRPRPGACWGVRIRHEASGQGT